MLHNLLKKALIGCCLVGLMGFVSLPAVHAADLSKQKACEGVGGHIYYNDWSIPAGETRSEGECVVPGALSLPKVIANVVNFVSWAVGLVAVLMLIVGGFLHMTAGGDVAKAKKAGIATRNAIIGLAIAAVAQISVQFVLHKLSSGATATDPRTCDPAPPGTSGVPSCL